MKHKMKRPLPPIIPEITAEEHALLQEHGLEHLQTVTEAEQALIRIGARAPQVPRKRSNYSVRQQRIRTQRNKPK